ncbi:MAG: aminotransferase class IV [Sphingobacteriales bacterium]|nr:aminotransferase class IV [Sphingobacteriales bacterium]
MFVSLNGKTEPADQPVLLASNRGYRYGDGLFETMKLDQGRILLEDLHFKRLMKGLRVMQFEIPNLFSTGKLAEEILQLAEKNKVLGKGRVRLSLFRGNGGLNEGGKDLQYLIECWPLPDETGRFNENGLLIDIYPDARKSCDMFSGLKTANFLPYSMAALYAKAHDLNDCLVLNTAGDLADTTIANLFIIRENRLITPGEDQAAVDGVMRKYLLMELRKAGYPVEERAVSIADLEGATEVFLTNAIQGIRWVRQFRDMVYQNSQTLEIYNRFIKTAVG